MRARYRQRQAGIAATLGVAAVLGLAAAPAADAVNFGADLRRPANSGFDCTVMPLPDAFGNPIAFPSGQPSCTWFSAGRSYIDPRESTIVPVGRGTITRARVRVGPVTGPMRVVVLSVLRNQADTICCKQVAQTRVFTPRPNGITTLRTNFRVRNSRYIDPRTGFADYHVIALSVLAPGVPVPLSDTRNYQPLGGPIATAMFPALAPREERAGGAGQVGYMVMLNATWRRRR